MIKIIKMNNINLKLNDNVIFDNFSFFLPSKCSLSIIGTPSSGKTSLLKLMAGYYTFDGYLEINGISYSSEYRSIINKYFMVVLDNDIFIKSIVIDELSFGLENQNFSKKEIKERLDELSNLFNIKDIMFKQVNNLDNKDKALVKILSYAVLNPSIIAIDNLLNYLKKENKDKLITYLKNKGITLINVTTNMEEVLYTDYILVLNKGKIVMEGKTDGVLKEEKILNRLGLGLPFVADLSLQLKTYEVVNDIYLDSKKLVGAIWK